jgi:acetylornithine deacetylase/succinyl-diaminopimelate desuccinylase-like protein
MDGAVADYLERERDRHLAELVTLASFPSVSTASEHAGDVAACAGWLAAHLERIGLEHVGLLPTGGNPIVYGDWLHAPAAPTVLVYGHYDVQPSPPDELWETPPFEPTVREGRLYGRGVSDSKGQFLAALAAIEALLAAGGRLPCNVRVLLEGEEELSADNLTAFLAANADTGLLDADLALVTDSGMLREDVPGVATGLRGMSAVHFTVRTASGDLHSGVYGGAVPNALQALAVLLASLKDEATGRVLVEGFYDDVRPIAEEERRGWAELPFDEVALVAELGVEALRGEEGFTPYERMWGRPTLDVCGAWGGHVGEGLKTVIPAAAHATLSCRLVPDQDAEGVVDLLERHLVAHAPAGATVTIDWRLPGCWPIVLPSDHPGVTAALAALADGFEREARLFRAGFSVPVAELLRRFLGIDSVLLGFILPDENLHAPNEFVRLDVFARGIGTYAGFFEKLAQ